MLTNVITLSLKTATRNMINSRYLDVVFHLKQLISQSKFSGPRKFTLSYQHLEITVVEIFIKTGNTVQIVCIGTDRSQQTVQTKIRLLLKKQSDQGLRCLPFHQHLLDALMQCYIKLFYF